MALSVFAVCLKLWTPVAVPFSYSHSIPRHVVESAAESRVEFVLWQDDRVILVKAYYYLAKKGYPANYT